MLRGPLRLPFLVLALAMLIVPSCASSPPDGGDGDPAPKTGHECLACWGPSASAVNPLLQEKLLALGPSWARALQDEATFLAMEALKKDLQKALDLPVTDATRMPNPTLPQDPTLDLIKDLCLKVRDGVPADPVQVGLTVDGNSGFHLPGAPAGWLNTLYNGLTGATTPNTPETLDRAHRLCCLLKEALDM